jgi:hypothetical protein
VFVKLLTPRTLCSSGYYRPIEAARRLIILVPREYSELPQAGREATSGASQHRARKAPSDSKITVSSQRCPFAAASASGFWIDAVQRPDQTHPATAHSHKQGATAWRTGRSRKVAGPPRSTGQEPGPGRNVTDE